jgi:hypothetical protein
MVIIVAFLLSLTFLFLGMMFLGALVHLWPLLIPLALYIVYRNHRRSCHVHPHQR